MAETFAELALLLRFLRTVLGTSLITLLRSSCIKYTANDVVTNPWQVFDPSAANQNNAMFLQVMADSGNVSRDFKTVRQSDPCYFTKGRVRLFRRYRFN